MRAKQGILNIMERGEDKEVPKFSSPEEELLYLRKQVAEKESELRGRGEQVSRAEITKEHIKEYKEKPSEDVLASTFVLPEKEKSEIVLNLAPDDDDSKVEELFGVMQERGIKNALSVAHALKEPHVEDDFHRFLVQYIKEGHPITDLKEKGPLWQVLHMTLFEVSLPTATRDGHARPFRELVSAMEQLYSGLFSSQDVKDIRARHFSFEIAVAEATQEIVFYVAVPTHKKSLFEKQLLSLFPKAQLFEQPNDYNVFVHGGNSVAAKAVLAHEGILPIRQFDEFDHDPLAVILNAFSKIEKEGVGASIQIIARPAGEKYLQQYKEVKKKVENGDKLKRAYSEVSSLMGGVAREFGGVFKEMLTGPKKRGDAELKSRDAPDHSVIEGIEKKIASKIIEAHIRIVVSTKDMDRAREILSDIETSFEQFSAPSGNSLRFELVRDKDLANFLSDFSFRKFESASSLPLNLKELATVMHFPVETTEVSPEFKQAKAAVAPAPLDLPSSGTLLGINTYRGTERNVYMTEEDRLRHMYVIGQTGTGKTTLLKNMILQDIESGAGVCMIDPHGSDIVDVLSNIPESRFDDVIYFDPSNLDKVMGLNMLEYDPKYPEQKTFVVNEMLSIFRKLYGSVPESMGPAFEQHFRNATLLVLEDPESGATLLDVGRVLADAEYRSLKLSRSKNAVVNEFWVNIATKTQGDASLQNIVPYITNKFDVFTTNEYMRPIVAQQKSAFNFRSIMDDKKILLVNLAKGRLGEINSHLLGLVLVGKIFMAALSRVDSFGKDMPPFYFYIDEFQNVTTNTIASILSEARKYKLSLTMAHQFIAQLEEPIRDAVFGNAGSIAVFRVGPDDSKFLESQFAPEFTANDILNIENYNAYVRLLAGGKPTKPFNIKTVTPPRGESEKADYLRDLSRVKYGRARDIVESEIAKKYIRGV
jgi:hypothetical protein